MKLDDRSVGRTGLQVSQVSLGAAEIGMDRARREAMEEPGAAHPSQW
jgi:aryl-alcohol dehydrogenase-like predicted oxidoreductase